METKGVGAQPLLEWGVASLAFPGEAVSGDLHLVQPFPGGALVAAVDGLGHGEGAARAAQVAVATLQAHAHEAVLALLQRCHEALRETRGAVLTVASFHSGGTVAWGGVGTVEAVLLRADARAGPAREEVLLHPGILGLPLPPLRCAVLPVAPGDTLLLATDGVRGGFADGLRLGEPPQQLAERILARDAKSTDDALVLVARYLGGVP
jgi:hypothetical protein